MKYNETDYNKIDIKDNFMFCTVMRKPGLCKEFLERVLGVSIKKIQYVDGEKSVDIAIDAKSIRLDVYLNDEKGTVYDLEMQKSDTLEIPKRSRYYSSLIDLDVLKKGQFYNELPPNIVLFICDFDLFSPWNKALYCFENRCIDNTDLALNDGTMKAFLNIKGDLTEVSKQMKSLLQYFDTGLISDEFTASLNNEVISTKNNEQWRLKYVTLQNALTEKYILGHKEGQLETIHSLLQKDVLTPKQAADELGISIETLNNMLEKLNETN